MLETNIHKLLVWVHPDWEPVDKEVLSHWRSIITEVAHDPSLGLVETVASPSRMGLSPKEQREMYCYGRYRTEELDHFFNVAVIEAYAKRVLKDRYQCWGTPPFIEPTRDTDRFLLATWFNPNPDLWDTHSELPRGDLFEAVAVYGLMPGSCVTRQAAYFEKERVNGNPLVLNCGYYPSKQQLREFVTMQSS